MMCLGCAIEKKIMLVKESLEFGLCSICNRTRVVGEPKK